MNTPTTIIIFGATGDLSRRKLLPALFDLFLKRFLPEHFRIVGFSRGDLSHEKFRLFVRGSIDAKKHNHTEEHISQFLNLAFYQQGLFNDAASYERLAEFLIKLDGEAGQCSNKLLYLAVPPAFYDTIFQNLADSGLSIPCTGGTAMKRAGWTRVLVEKPFGDDIKTAQALDTKLGLLFKEEQIFRIDHYLAKETLQNILAFRFSNALFEPLWNNRYIEKVDIKFLEALGVEGRGAFYDSVGALRDVGQNHMLQMLVFLTMENPGILEAGPIRRERAKILRALEKIKKEDIPRVVRRGQYIGYRDENGVDKKSETETYFFLRAFIKNKRWNGVPFYLESGKALKEKRTEIAVTFRETPCLCPPEGHERHQNVLTFRIQPDEGISILFWAKHPGFQMHLEPKKLSFSYADSEDMKKLPDAYERILYDCIRGDQTLFASTEEVEAAWKFITPILKNWKKTSLIEYEKGGSGPNKKTFDETKKK